MPDNTSQNNNFPVDMEDDVYIPEPAPAPSGEIEPDPKLIAQGWQRRFMTDPKQAQEAIQMYNDLGFEVRAEPIPPSTMSDVCRDCQLVTCTSYVHIYTRKKD